MTIASDTLDRRIAATIAIHRIEGWRPAVEDVDALRSCARGSRTLWECLSDIRSRRPSVELRRRRLRLGRGVPYLIPGTTLLRNEFGVTTAEGLSELEYFASAVRMVEWLGADHPGTDVRDIHRHLFGDAYAWAGRYRTVDIRRGASGFAGQTSITERMAGVHDSAATLAGAGVTLDTPRLAYELARLYAEYNQVHPFRDGNGRTGAVLLTTLAGRCGRQLDWTVVTREQWYSAAADSAPLHRDGRASHRPFLYPLNAALR